MYCPHCGKQNWESARFCCACGAPLALPSVPSAQKVPPRPKRRNVPALVLGIVGASFAAFGAVVWLILAAFAEAGAEVYLAVFLLFGLGGAAVSVVGCVQAFRYGAGRLLLSLIGLWCEIGCLFAQIWMCVREGPPLILSGCTVIAVVLLLVESVFSAAKKPRPV